MIPSRPLDLGGIIGETIRIITKTYWRAALLLLIFCAPGFFVMQVGLEEAFNGLKELAQEFTSVSPDAPLIFRDYLFVSN